MDGGHLPALAHPDELAARLEAYGTTIPDALMLVRPEG
jgi:hypothetical protein